MSEESKVRDVVDAVSGIVQAVPIYQDVAQPAAQEVGKALQTVAKTIHVALAPISALVWGYDQIKDFVSKKVADRLKNVPPENIVTPKPNVAGPVLEALRYTGHESELSNLYANLLASSMDETTARGAHPAFVEIIKQLTPDEAKLIAYFLNPIPLPMIDVKWEFKEGANGRTGGKVVLENYSHFGVNAGCECPDLVPSYIGNLCRLGLVEAPPMYQYTAEGVYDEIENSGVVREVKLTFERTSEVRVVIDRKGLRVTPLGRQFAKICVVRG